MEGNQKRRYSTHTMRKIIANATINLYILRFNYISSRWDRLRKLLRLLVGRRKKRRFAVPDQSTCIAAQTSTGEDDPGPSRSSGQEPALLPPESARLAILSPSNDILASLNKFRLSTAASR